MEISWPTGAVRTGVQDGDRMATMMISQCDKTRNVALNH